MMQIYELFHHIDTLMYFLRLFFCKYFQYTINVQQSGQYYNHIKTKQGEKKIHLTKTRNDGAILKSNKYSFLK